MGLGKYLVISDLVEKTKYGRVDKNNLEDIFESFFGAFYHDIGKNNLNIGVNLCYNFFVDLMNKYVNIAELINVNDNFKHMLMEYFHKEYNGKLPIYKSSNVEEKIVNKITKKVYIEAVYDFNGKFIANGRSTTKQKAQQFAAKHALIKYGVITPFNSRKNKHIKSLAIDLNDINRRFALLNDKKVVVDENVASKKVASENVVGKKIKIKIKKSKLKQ